MSTLAKVGCGHRKTVFQAWNTQSEELLGEIEAIDLSTAIAVSRTRYADHPNVLVCMKPKTTVEAFDDR